jgi:non-homologous end joining protein Ku
MTDDTIYVALLDEGVDVWRPVKARRLSPDRYLILEQEYDRDMETWAYEPGTVVECRAELRNGQERIFAVGTAERDRKNSVMHKALVWEGQLRISLVSCPVSLYAATTDGLDRPDQIQTGDINIECFVEEEQIDPVYLSQPYHLVPRGALAEETFTVLLEAMRRKRLVALSSISFQSIGRKVALFTARNTLRVYVLRYKREVLEEQLFAAQLETARPDQEMLDLATRLLDNKKGRFIPVDELPETKQETALKEAIRAGKVVSLDEALRKSLEARSAVIRSNSRRTGGSK